MRGLGLGRTPGSWRRPPFVPWGAGSSNAAILVATLTLGDDGEVTLTNSSVLEQSGTITFTDAGYPGAPAYTPEGVWMGDLDANKQLPVTLAGSEVLTIRFRRSNPGPAFDQGFGQDFLI